MDSDIILFTILKLIPSDFHSDEVSDEEFSQTAHWELQHVETLPSKARSDETPVLCTTMQLIH